MVGAGSPEAPLGPGGPLGPTTLFPGSPRLPGDPATGDAPNCSTCEAKASRALFAV